MKQTQSNQSLSFDSISGIGSLIPVSLCEISFLGSGMETWYVVLATCYLRLIALAKEK